MSRTSKLQRTFSCSGRSHQESNITVAFNRRKMDEPRFLCGWKEIANYLGKGVRTVQRYERYMGFPVRRPAGRPRAAVIATKAELDAWVAASPIRREFQLARPDTAASHLTSVATGIAEMRRLVGQLQSLKNELKTSVHVLAGTIHVLEKDAIRRTSNGGLELRLSPQADRIHGLPAPYTGQPRVN